MEKKAGDAQVSLIHKKGFRNGFLILGLITAFFVGIKTYDLQSEKTVTETETAATESFLLLKNDFEWHIQSINSMKGFFLASNWVSLDEFKIYTGGFLEEQTNYDALGWIPIIEAPSTANDIIAKLTEKNPKFSIKNREDLKKEKFCPIAYIEPYQKYAEFLGTDLTHNTTLKSALMESMQTARPVAFIGTPFETVPEGTLPQSAKLTIVNAVQDKRSQNRLNGFLFSVIDLQQIVGKSFSPLGKTGLNITILDKQEGGAWIPIYNMDKTPKNNGTSEIEKENPYLLTREMELAGHHLVFLFEPSVKIIQWEIYKGVIITSGFILMLTLMIYYYMRNMSVYTEHLTTARIAAEKATRMQRDFMANMSHELRTPMTGILGLTDVLKDSCLDKEQKSIAESIHLSAESLLSLLNGILDLSRIESGEVIVENDVFDLHQFFKKIKNLIGFQASRKGLSFSININEDLPQMISGDETKIQEVVINLLSNAVKFTSKGGVSLRTNIKTATNREYLIITIADTGIGIPDDFKDKIFKKFTQADSSVSRKFGGTGLGLAITKKLIDIMGGTISYKSTPDMGTEFTVTIPIQRADEKAKTVSNSERNTAINAESSTIRLAKVMIVEDHEINQMLVFKWLKKMGFEAIDIANSGIEALENLKTQHYDLILMDCQMPELDGYKTTGIIRQTEHASDKDVPIIAMTAHAMANERQKCLDAGMDDYLSKPMDFIDLQNAVYNQLDPARVKEKAYIKSSQATTQDNTPMNLDRLKEFTDGDKAAAERVINLFLKRGEETLNVMAENCDKKPNKLWRDAAHTLKGASGSLGANRLYQLCIEAEENYDREFDDKVAILQSLEHEFLNLSDYLRSLR